MGTPKVILFYVLAPLPDPEAVRVWQQALAGPLGLRGRVLVSPHGINATLGGDLLDLKAYVRGLRAYAPFRGADVKWSAGRALADGTTTALFPRLSVKVRDELVTTGRADRLVVDEDGVVGGAEHVSPERLNELVEQEDAVLLDGRNSVESEVGRFRGAVRPVADTTRDIVAAIESGAWDHLRERPVVTYCTGGIRCEVLTPLLRDRGFTRLYQLEGGIARYGERFGDDGLWEGSMYVFDARDTVEFSDRSTVVGRCDTCGTASRDVRDCSDPACVRQVVRCAACAGPSPRCDLHLVG